MRWTGLALAFATLAGPLSADDNHPVDKLKPGEWFEAPNSTLAGSGVYPPQPLPPGRSPSSVMAAWSGAALDTKRDTLIIHGGGHGDYSGNEIYVFDLVHFKWTRPWGPSKEIPPLQPNGPETYPDGAPASIHSYDGLIYLPVQDKLLRLGGGLWSGAGNGTPSVWTFDFAKLTWQRKAGAPRLLGVGVGSDYDPVGGHVFAFSDKGNFGEYDPDKDAWTPRGGVARGEETVAAIDPEARLFVIVGNGIVASYDIRTGKTSRQKTAGNQAVVNARGPGLVYDPKLKRIVGWAGGTSFHSLDTATWTWSEHKASAGNSVTPALADGRLLIFSRFQYWPARNAYVVVSGVDKSVTFGKIAPVSR